jgi:LPXTG-motif cell wall-anchored protein
MRIRYLVTSAAAMVAIAVPVLQTPVTAAEPCPVAQPPSRVPGRNASQGQPTTNRPSEYPPGQCQLLLSQSAAAAGARVTVSGSGFEPASAVALSAGSASLGRATADSAGGFTTSFVVPSSLAPGGVAVLATGVDATGAARQLSADFTVLPSATSRAASGRGLPKTGSSATVPLISVAVGLLCIGAIAVVSSRRRSI